MSDKTHRIYLFTLATIVVMTLVYLSYAGYSYYITSMEERFYHEDHKVLKPSGVWGHGLGIIGSLFMIAGVSSYMVRKRSKRMQRWGKLSHWLEFHIFLCTMGPILVLFHTSFKFGGIVSVSFWSMVAVFLSGVIGRFIYIQIPRTIEGRELSLNEVRNLKTDIGSILKENFRLEEQGYQSILESTTRKVQDHKTNIFSGMIRNYIDDRQSISTVKKVLKKNKLKKPAYKSVLTLVKNEISLNRRIDRLQTMQNLFKYWHVAHLPFALVMLIIMVIHVVVTIIFGYRWIF